MVGFMNIYRLKFFMNYLKLDLKVYLDFFIGWRVFFDRGCFINMLMVIFFVGMFNRLELKLGKLGLVLLLLYNLIVMIEFFILIFYN